MVADVIGQHVVSGVVQRLVLGGEEIDLEPAEAAELGQMAGIAVTVPGQEVVVNDQSVGVGRNEPPLQRDAVQGWESHVLVFQSDFVGGVDTRGARRPAVVPVVQSWTKLSKASCVLSSFGTAVAFPLRFTWQRLYARTGEPRWGGASYRGYRQPSPPRAAVLPTLG